MSFINFPFRLLNFLFIAFGNCWLTLERPENISTFVELKDQRRTIAKIREPRDSVEPIIKIFFSREGTTSMLLGPSKSLGVANMIVDKDVIYDYYDDNEYDSTNRPKTTDKTTQLTTTEGRKKKKAGGTTTDVNMTTTGKTTATTKEKTKKTKGTKKTSKTTAQPTNMTTTTTTTTTTSGTCEKKGVDLDVDIHAIKVPMSGRRKKSTTRPHYKKYGRIIKIKVKPNLASGFRRKKPRIQKMPREPPKFERVVTTTAQPVSECITASDILMEYADIFNAPKMFMQIPRPPVG